ncbi:hypothetical protein H9P43_007020 [Blastocladiella emersonii ATCC 22665]|nr:hypothetical protein H9P43_007020 [Blastocladiella emersonii ATCC 22665]
MNSFTVHVTGELESIQIDSCDALYAKLTLTAGADWALVDGAEELMTQLAHRHRGAAIGPGPGVGVSGGWLWTGLQFVFGFLSSNPSISARDADVAVWACPVHAVWRATNVYGWPQAVAAVYGLDALGRDVLVGYAVVRLPRHAGRHTVYAPLFAPVASSPLNGFLSWLVGRPPEFLDPLILAQCEGRQATRVRSDGTVKLVLNVAIKDMEKFGYQLGPSGNSGGGGSGVGGGGSGG